MDVCFVNYTPYGTQGNTFVFKLSQALSDLVDSVTVVGIDPTASGEGVRTRTVDRVTVRQIPIERDVHSRKLIRFCQRVTDILEAGAFDVVQVFSFRGASLVPLLARWRGIHRRSTWIYQLIQVSFNTEPARYRLSNRVTRFESNRFQATVTSTDGILREVYGRDSASSENRYVLPLGVDTERFRPDPQTRAETRAELGYGDETVFVSVGSMNEERDLESLVRGFATAEASTNRNHRLLFVGEGAVRSDLESVAATLGVDERIDFLGRVPFDDVPNYLAAGDVGVSHISNATPQRVQPALKVTEYLASRLPVMATDTSGNRLYVDDGYNGILYESEPERVADAIEDVFEPTTLEVLRGNARESVRSFATPKLAGELLDIYEDLGHAVNRPPRSETGPAR